VDRFGDPGSGMIPDVCSTVRDLPPIAGVIRHPDYNVWNLVRDGDRIHVIDWEGAEPGPPLCDLVQFTVHWHEYVTRRRPRMPDEDGMRALLVERTRTAPADAAVSRVYGHYMRELAIPDQWFHVLAVTAWVELALRRERQLVDAGSPRDERDRNNFGVRYVEALAAAWRHAPSGLRHEAGVP
jgi:thiamine kinase-like enzyme